MIDIYIINFELITKLKKKFDIAISYNISNNSKFFIST